MRKVVIIDGNFFMQKYFHGIRKDGILMQNESDIPKLISEYSKRLTYEIGEFGKSIDAIIFVKDGYSWRKNVHIVRPKDWKGDFCLAMDYKANRKRDDDINWDNLHKAFDQFVDKLQDNFNVPVTKIYGAEGDDVIWAWTKVLKNLQIKTIVWGTDKDLYQLLDDNTIIYRNIKTDTREWVVANEYYENSPINGDNILVDYTDPDLELFKHTEVGRNLTIIDPLIEVFKKMVSGDIGDNIPPILEWYPKSSILSVDLNDELINDTLETFKKVDDELSLKFVKKFLRSLVKTHGSSIKIDDDVLQTNIDEMSLMGHISTQLLHLLRRIKEKTPTTRKFKANENHTTKVLEELGITSLSINDFYSLDFITNFVNKLIEVTEQKNIDVPHTISIFEVNRNLVFLNKKEIPEKVVSDIKQAIKPLLPLLKKQSITNLSNTNLVVEKITGKKLTNNTNDKVSDEFFDTFFDETTID